MKNFLNKDFIKILSSAMNVKIGNLFIDPNITLF